MQESLCEWLDSPLGAVALRAEQEMIAPYLSRMFGYHILQIGCSAMHSLIADSPVGHKIIFSPRSGTKYCAAVADNEALPLASDSIDIVLIHHALDFTRDSHKLLREAARVLRPGGQLLIVGFNPYSIWGINKAMRSRAGVPWNGRFISRRRVIDWLKLLELQIEHMDVGLHFLPSKWRKLLASAEKVEEIGNKLGNPFGGAYFLIGIKRVLPVTPILPRWRPIRPRATVMPAAENIRIKKLH